MRCLKECEKGEYYVEFDYYIHYRGNGLNWLAYNMSEYICDSFSMGKRDLPDMYTRSPRAEGIHIRQIMSAYVLQVIPYRHGAST